MMAYELHRQLRIPHWSITMSPHKPENFLAQFDYPEQRDAALRAGSFYVGPSCFFIHPWRLDSHTRPTSWPFHVKICIEHMPLHAWSAEGVKLVLGDVCIFDYMEDAAFWRENTEIFYFFAWMKNPNLLPRSKVVTFFSEQAGRSSASDGPPPIEAARSLLPSGGDVDLLIHLDHFYDWSPQQDNPSSSSDVSGLPASSSKASSGKSCPVFQSFTWYPGVIDGQMLGHPSGPRMVDPCCQPPIRECRDDEHEDDGRGPAGRDWRRNINARGRPADDLPRSGTQGMRQRMHPPPPRRTMPHY
jgi:hypothetical protein